MELAETNGVVDVATTRPLKALAISDKREFGDLFRLVGVLSSPEHNVVFKRSTLLTL